MRHDNASRWPFLALAGIGLATIPLAAGVTAAARRRHRENGNDHDSAPGHTARRSFGDYQVVGRTVTIARPRSELYAFWRDFSNLSTFMGNLERVEPVTGDAALSVWHIKGPLGTSFAIETRIAREIENELIAWRSTEASEIDTEGRVTFEDAPGDRGTRVGLIIAYKPKGGKVGDILATLAGRSPEMQARHDLKRLKMLMETGEIATPARTYAEYNKEEPR